MKAETKAKCKAMAHRAWEAIKPWIAPLAVATTIYAAWEGLVESARNEREIDSLRKEQHEMDIKLRDYDRALVDTRLSVEDLREQNEELLEQAMNVTEGKESA